MASTRRRGDDGSLSGGDEAEEERPPKTQRLSSGSSSCTASLSPDGSTTGRVNALTGASSSSHDHGHGDEDDDDDVVELVVGDHNGDIEEDQEAVDAQRSGRTGKGKRRATDLSIDDAARKEDEDEEVEEEVQVAGADDADDSERENRRVPGEIVGEDRNTDAVGTSTVAAAAGENGVPSSSSASKRGTLESKKRSSVNNNNNNNNKDNTSSGSEAGVVLRVHARNFMCHRALTVQFCKRVNFINGRNGSGKSAILAALQICLGARAHLTHRAKKMTDFIRHGWKHDALVEVTLLNNEHGFKYDEYGDSITVRRTINRPSGGGTFTLLGHDGTVKSKAKAEMSRMLDTLNIQIDNPCAVLDQENSKKFLQGSAHEKYAFFMRAMDLDRIVSNNDVTGYKITTMRDGHHVAVTLFPKYQYDVKQKRTELKEFQKLEDLQDEIVRLKERIVWAYVEELEEERDGLTDKFKQVTLQIKALEERIAGFEAALAGSAAEKEEVKERLDAMVAETERLQEERRKTAQTFKEELADLPRLRSQRSALEKEVEAQKGEKKAATVKLKAARETAKRNASDDQEKSLLDDIQRAEDSLADVRRTKEARGGEEKIAGLRATVRTAADSAETARKELVNAGKDATDRRAEWNSLRSGTFDPTSAIAAYMPALVKRIERESRQFQRHPVGPLGAFIQLKEEHRELRICIEGHLGRNLASFVVACQTDKTALMALMKAFRGNGRWPLPTIIVQTHQDRYSTVAQNPSGFLQIMQAVNITHDQVLNCLVDQCSIEKICLFASKEQAETACLRGASGRYERMPHGMFEAYYPSQGGKSCNKFNVSDGNLQTRTNVVNVRRHRRVLGIDHRTQLREAEAHVEQAQAVAVDARRAADSAARSLNRAKAALEEEEVETDRLDKQESQLGREKGRLSTELMALQSKNNDATDPTEERQRELEAATEALEEEQKALKELDETIAKVSADAEPAKKAAGDARKAHEQCSDAANKISEELEEGGVREIEHRRKVTRAQAALAKTTKELEDLSVVKKTAEEKAGEEEKKARDCMQNFRARQGKKWDGQRVTPGARSDTLCSKLAKKKGRYEGELEKRRLKSKSREEVRSNLHEAITHQEEMHTLADKLADNMDCLTDERKKRLSLLRKLRDFASRKTSFLFNEYLGMKGASGQVTFDHDNGTMGITYQKDNTDDTSRCEDVRQLSGGERSFATLSLLLAIGSSNECPFRVMDEFDVFMDAVSRNIALQQFIDFSALDPPRQYIIITPQDLSSVNASESCKIIKLKPPGNGDHNQTTLEESFGSGAS